MRVGTSAAGPSRTDGRGGSSPAAGGRWRAQRGGGVKISLLIPCRAEPLLDLPRACRGGRRGPPPRLPPAPPPPPLGGGPKKIPRWGGPEGARPAPAPH